MGGQYQEDIHYSWEENDNNLYFCLTAISDDIYFDQFAHLIFYNSAVDAYFLLPALVKEEI